MINREEDTGEFSEEGNVPRVYSPWRRFFARSFDLSLYNLLWLGFLALMFQENIVRRTGLENYLDTFMVLLLMLFLEPIWLRYFKSTPGKKILGMKIENLSGEPLSYKEGFERTFGVIVKGLGLNIPIYNLFCLYKSYTMLGEKIPLSWEQSSAYIVKDRKKYRIALYLLGMAMALVLMVTLVFSQRVPPNFNDLP